jgi:ADP-ribose pyrophosphatase
MKKFSILSRKKVLDTPFCPIEKQIVILPNGKKTEWFINTCSSAVVIVPILSSGKILLQKCYKHGSGEIITEFCAGCIDSEETPLKSAERELKEETGYTGEFIFVGECFANPTGSTMQYFFFIAQNCKKITNPSLDQAEQIEPFFTKNLKTARELLMSPANKTSSATLTALVFAEKFFVNTKKTTSDG